MSAQRRSYAHTSGADPADWEPLEDHLRNVARLAGTFAAAFDAQEWGYLAGLWHDVGKYSDEFQKYLRDATQVGQAADSHRSELGASGYRKVDHSTAGAQWAAEHVGGAMGRLLAYCIAGHHGGLADAKDLEGGQSGLDARLHKDAPVVRIPVDIGAQTTPLRPTLSFDADPDSRAFTLSVWCRMLFSCLVDADFLATEQFMQPQQADARTAYPLLQKIQQCFNVFLQRKTTDARPTPVNRHRVEILLACRRAAALPPGLFSLTVPTGGGKTFSSMAFALDHALRYNQQRVIYGIPFTSIIEQNARQFREALAGLGQDTVLEHHSNLDPDDEKATERSRLAAENWDAPIIVTTNVQLLESLFASKPSRCRRLHNLVRSVIVLDEVQTLPVELLTPTLAMLNELCRNYGCTVLLCSATQPAVAWRADFSIGLKGVREIIPDPPSLFTALKRVRVEPIGRTGDDELIEKLEDHPQVLCIVNTRKHAAELFGRLKAQADESVFHLSAQMCPCHRSDILEQIRTQLGSDAPCRVISTQLIEAGVDIDFPVVYRAMAGIDSIAQAAGRCNREGKRTLGHTYVFETDAAPPPGMLRDAAASTQELLRHYPDLLSLDAVEAYFQLHYWKKKEQWDHQQVIDCFRYGGQTLHLQFRQAAERYRLIRDVQTPILVPYDNRARKLIGELSNAPSPPGVAFMRRCQSYIVNIREGYRRHLDSQGALVAYHGIWTINPTGTFARSVYDAQLGLWGDSGPDAFMA